MTLQLFHPSMNQAHAMPLKMFLALNLRQPAYRELTNNHIGINRRAEPSLMLRI